MLAVSVILSLMLTISVGQIVDPYMLYGGGLAMYGGEFKFTTVIRVAL